MKHKTSSNKKSKINPSINLSVGQQLSKIFRFFLVVLIFLFLISNLFSSQIISPVYFRLINDEKKAAIEFLEKIKKLPEFKDELKKYKTIYGKTIEEEVFAKEIREKQMIKNLEQILEKNPKSRDVLYSLYLLYDSRGDKIKAKEYLRQAKEVDPNMKD